MEQRDEISFEDAFSKIEKILEELNENNLPLSVSLERYEEAHGLIKHCYKLLDLAEQKIEVIVGCKDDPNNRDELAFDDSAQILSRTDV